MSLHTNTTLLGGPMDQAGIALLLFLLGSSDLQLCCTAPSAAEVTQEGLLPTWQSIC